MSKKIIFLCVTGLASLFWATINFFKLWGITTSLYNIIIFIVLGFIILWATGLVHAMNKSLEILASSQEDLYNTIRNDRVMGIPWIDEI